MRFREHRGGLGESLETCVEVETLADLEKHIVKVFYPFGDIDPSLIQFTKYCKDGDFRIGWKELYIVTCPSWGVLGWTDFDPKELK